MMTFFIAYRYHFIPFHILQSFAQLPHLKKHMLCVHNTDKPYYCEKCEGFFKVKTEYEEHAARDHPEDLPVGPLSGVLETLHILRVVRMTCSPSQWRRRAGS